MTSYLHEFRVEPGAKVKLRQIDPAYTGNHESKKSAQPELKDQLSKMDQLQYLMYAEREHSLLIVLQGLDAGGKDGVIRDVMTGMNPAGVRVVSFKQPTPMEREHDFLWRVHPHVPGKGKVAVFNRSHYEDVLIVRVHNLVPPAIWKARYDLINDFEELLCRQNNTTILKFFLYISKEEQLERFKDRLDDPARHWKISDADYSERLYWDDYIAAFEEVMERTSTEHAPWFVIPADRKWFRNLAIARIIVDTLEGLEMKMPRPSVNLAEIRKKYHAAAAEQTTKSTSAPNLES